MSCVEKISTEIPDKSDHITVTSEVSPHTKAGYEGTSVLPGTFTMTIRQGTATSPDYTMTKSGSSNSYSFPQGSVPTWETSDVSQVSIKAITTPSGYDMATGVMTIPTDQSSAANVQASDLLGAKSGAGITISGNNINVAFNHLMSKLQVSYSSSLEVDHIELANVAVTGTFSYADMKHSYSGSQSGTITKMYSTGNSAEAIFFPFDPRELKVTPKLSIYVSGKDTPIECDITLREGTRFVPGKVYMVKISVTGTSANADVTVESWGANASVQVPGERVLWVGTSIPAGAPEAGFVSYPEYVDEAMNCTIVNNAVGGSLVVMKKDATWTSSYGGWVLPEQDPTVNWQLIMTAGALSQTIKEADDIYRPHFVSLLNGDTTNPLIDQELNKIKALSYENLIIPYINGEKDNCTTVIIDHGFNDRGVMYNDAGGYYMGEDMSISVRGYSFLMDLANGKKDLEDYKTQVLASQQAGLPVSLENSYIYRMSQVIQEIKEANPNVRIIIGNYFTTTNPYTRQVDAELATWPDFERLPRLICANNQALAGIWNLDIVNVQNYLWISDDEYWAGWDSNANAPIYDVTKFCPDGVHPWANPESIQAIADVYIRELEGVIGSRVN